MEKINIAEILKDCPKGMELDCTMYEDVYFDCVDELNIIHCYIQCETYRTSLKFYQYGTPNCNTKAKCVIFPKGKTTWEGFQRPFKDGDVAISDKGDIHLLRTKDSSYCAYRERWNGLPKFDRTITTDIKVVRHATEEEKQTLFQAIKENGYTWNEETKTLEKLVEPKFKVGDRIILKDNPFNIPSIKITAVTKSQYILENEGFFYISSADEKYVLEDKFDITTLKPFDKVLYRMHDKDTWCNSFYSFYKNNHHFVTSLTIVKQCIPYEGNEHLCGTTDDCDEFYKTWE